MVFPIIKLSSLVLKQASKYVAAVAKTRAKNSPSFRRFLVKNAAYYHSVQTKLKMRLLNLGSVKEVKPLSEEMAVQLGTELIGDIVLITCGLVIYLTVESSWGKSNSKDKTEELKEDLEKIQATLVDQSIEMERQAAHIRELERLMHSKDSLMSSVLDKLSLGTKNPTVATSTKS